MEMAGMIVGMALAFVLGAYIRKPFEWTRARKETPPPIEPPEEQTGKRKRDKAAQLDNLLSYTGSKQTEDDFEN